MKVDNYELPPEVEAKALEWMRRGVFQAGALKHMLIHEGVLEFVAWDTWRAELRHCAKTIADRLIKREAAAGNIEQRHGRGLWSWVKKEGVA